jgi:tRNA threonylcarbamoyladenosine biosynthesis protein TsaE
MTTEFSITLNQLSNFVKELLTIIGEAKVILFEGDLGSGKTTLIKEICKQLKVSENTGSPTFSIVNHYRCENGNSVFHFDLYRLKNKSEVMEIGMDEYIQSGNYCLIEWPEIGADFYPDNTVTIEINGSGVIRNYRVSTQQ